MASRAGTIVEMRLLAAVLSVIAASTAGATVSDVDAAKRTAKLHATSTQPLKVRGVGFAPRERVRVTARSRSAAKAKAVVASAAGRFEVTFPTIAVDRCNGAVVSALGSEGSRVGLKLPQPLCPPPL